MAVITKIGGVATSGTSGVNNIFGSGGGGSSSATTTPTISILNSTTFGGNSIFVSNYGASTNYGQLRLEVVQDTGGVNITPDPNDFTLEIVSGIALVSWEDSSSYAGGYSVNVYMVDMDSNPAEITSAISNTVTYTKTVPKFKYYRLRVVASNGAASKSSIAVSDIQLFASPNAQGTQYTGVNNSYSEYLSDYSTGRDDMIASDGYNYSSYDGWKAFNNSVGIGSAWWTIINNTAANNWIQLEWIDQTQNSNSRWATAADFPPVGSVRVRTETNGDASYMEVMGSDTGAFSGEEHSFGLTAISEATYQTINA